MPTLVHLSDLHFGPAYVPHLGELILSEIAMLKPDVVVVSGDFTMRGRHTEYAHARAYLDRMTTPTLTIPGNHDQPLFAPFERLVRPMARYEKYIHNGADAMLATRGWFIAGLNDNRPILPGGFWSRAQRAWLTREFANAPRAAVKVLATHHQLDWAGKWKPAGIWFPSRARDLLAHAGVELVLNGHTHIPNATQTLEGIVIARAGTATCNRLRHGNSNSYNFITFDDKEICVFVRRFDERADAFVSDRAFTFQRGRKF
ncbi:MAG: metallophosphoesterase [Chloroflexi bacterium]|nr:metallophosphoesterase [Chloroflexota bacterium]